MNWPLVAAGIGHSQLILRPLVGPDSALSFPKGLPACSVRVPLVPDHVPVRFQSHSGYAPKISTIPATKWSKAKPNGTYILQETCSPAITLALTPPDAYVHACRHAAEMVSSTPALANLRYSPIG